MIIFANKKLYPYLAIISGWYLGGVVGAAASFFLTRELINNDSDSKISLELALLKLSSYLIKADGKITKAELDRVREYFNSKFGSSKSARLFKQHKQDKKTYSIEELTKVILDNMTPNQYYATIQFLFSVAASDGHISEGELDFIYKVGIDLSFTSSRLDSIKNQFISNRQKSQKSNKKFSAKELDAFALLGIKPGAPFEEIKSAHRKLVKEFHPDVLNNAHESIKKIAEEKFREIQQAYELLRLGHE